MEFRRAVGVIARRIAGETVLVPIAQRPGGVAEATQFFVLNATGETLWELLAEPASLETMAQHLSNTYEVSAERARADAQLFIEELQRHDMVTGSERM